jgi:hypothetical protein
MTSTAISTLGRGAGKPESARASHECAALLDHHIEEMLNAVEELGRGNAS